jgi:DHA1 family multidrug/chloramphenicol efflux transport protein-like MFS transporter
VLKALYDNRFILFLVLFEFTVYMANDLIMPGMIRVVQEFDSSDAAIPLSLSLYLLGGMLLQIFMGPLSDRWGRRPTLIGGCIYFMLATVLILFSTSMPFFLWARFFQGMGLCFIGVCGYATVQELFEEKKAVRVVAWMTTTSVTAPILGPILGGIFTDIFDWRWIFVFIFILSGIALWGLILTMPETVSFASSAPGESAQKARKEPASRKPHAKLSPRRFGPFQTLSNLFQPLFRSYWDVLKNPILVLGGCVNGFLTAPILCWIGISPIVLFENEKVSPLLYGAVQVPIFGLFILGNMLLRRFTYQYSLKQIVRMAFPLCLTGMGSMVAATYFFPQSSLALILPLSLYCLGDGIINAPITRLALYSSNHSKGTASAVFGLISNVIFIAAVSLMPMVFQGKNFHFAVFSLACTLVIWGSLGWFLRSDQVPESVTAEGTS